MEKRLRRENERKSKQEYPKRCEKLIMELEQPEEDLGGREVEGKRKCNMTARKILVGYFLIR